MTSPILDDLNSLVFALRTFKSPPVMVELVWLYSCEPHSRTASLTRWMVDDQGVLNSYLHDTAPTQKAYTRSPFMIQPPLTQVVDR